MSKTNQLWIIILSVCCLTGVSVNKIYARTDVISGSCVSQQVIPYGGASPSCVFTVPRDYKLSGYGANTVSIQYIGDTEQYTITWTTPGTFTITALGDYDDIIPAPTYGTRTVSVGRGIGPPSITGTSFICQSQTTSSLTASAANSSNFLWGSISPAGAGSVVVSGASHETATINWSQSFTGDATISVRAYGNYNDYKDTSPYTITRYANFTFTALPDIPPIVCDSSSVSIGVQVNGPATFVWYDKENTLMGTSSYFSVRPRVNAQYHGTVVPKADALPCLLNPEAIPVFTTLANFYVKPRVNNLKFTEEVAAVCTPATGTTTSQFKVSASAAESFSWSVQTGAVSLSTSDDIANGTSTCVVTWTTGFDGNAIIEVTANGCGGSTKTITRTIDVTPRPSLSSPTTDLTYAYCSTGNITLAPSVTPAAAYVAWTRVLETGLTGTGNNSGTGAFNHQLTLTAGVLATKKATYTIVPKYRTCSGTQKIATVSVKPVPALAVAFDSVTCSGATSRVRPSSTLPGTIYQWTATSTNVSSALHGSTASQMDTVLNLIDPLVVGRVTYTLTPKNNGCTGTPQQVKLKVNSKPAITNTTAQLTKTIFDRQGVNFTAAVSPAATSYSWTSTVTEGTVSGVSASGINSAAITDVIQLANNNLLGKVRYTLTPALTGCVGDPKYYEVSIYSIPVITASSTRIVGEPVILSTTSYDSYTWKNLSGTTVSTAQNWNTLVPGTYTVVVNKNGVVSPPSSPKIISAQFDEQNLNFRITNSVWKKGVLSNEEVDNLSFKDRSQQVEYYDGLGRMKQVINTQSSPAHFDLVRPLLYDGFGREYRSFLPVTQDKDGWYKDVIDSAGRYSGTARDFYRLTPKVAIDSLPFAETKFDASPLNRVSYQGSPGAAFQPGQGKARQIIYRANTEDEVLKFNLSEEGAVTLAPTVDQRFYRANTLQVTVNYDEHHQQVVEFVDRKGQTICKKVQAGQNEFACTYYLYDDFGNLVIVLPPMAVSKMMSVQQ